MCQKPKFLLLKSLFVNNGFSSSLPKLYLIGCVYWGLLYLFFIIEYGLTNFFYLVMRFITLFIGQFATLIPDFEVIIVEFKGKNQIFFGFKWVNFLSDSHFLRIVIC